MTLEPFLMYDPQSRMEIIFEQVMDGIDKTFVNEITNFRRYSDGTVESYLTAPGSRELTFNVKSSNPSDLRRKLYYLSRMKRRMILILGTYDFASEVVIKSFYETEGKAIEYPFEINVSCFGDLGQIMVGADTRLSGADPVADSNALGGYAIPLSSSGSQASMTLVANDIYMSAGAYMLVLRARSSAGIANDLDLYLYDIDLSAIEITSTHTISAGGYAYYLAEGSIDSANAGNTILIYAEKATAATNTIYVDMLAYIQSSQNAIITAGSGETTVELSPTYDNKMRSASPTTVYATDNYLDVGASGSSVPRPILTFDVSSIPASATIVSATLSLFWYHPAGATRTNSTVVQIFRAASSWNASYVCWNNRASGTAWTNAGGDWKDSAGTSQGTVPYDSVTFPAATVPDNAFHDWDITDLVQDWVDGTLTNYGIIIKANVESSNYIAFYSKDWSTASQRPKLTVVYTA